MKINLKEFLDEAGITEPLYPGKRFVHSCKQTGEFKSHCVVFDWRDPEKLRIEVRAGLSGKQLEPKELKYYPVSFQAPTYVDIEFVNDNADDEEDEDSKGKAKGGSGSKKPAKKKLEDVKSMAADAFGKVMEGKVPELGEIVEMFVMGKEVAKEAYAQVMEKLAKQINHAKIGATELLAQAGKFVTKYTPPAFMKPAGDEDASYKYDREKNADIGYRATM